MNLSKINQNKSILKKEQGIQSSQPKLVECEICEATYISDSSTNSDEENDDASVHVKFGQINIRKYDMILGDNPSCNIGPPVSLDWRYNEANSMPLEEYEDARGTRRKAYQMQIPPVHRRRILERSGVTPDEMEYTEKQMKFIKKGRERTKMMLPFTKLQEAAETRKSSTKA